MKEKSGSIQKVVQVNYSSSKREGEQDGGCVELSKKAFPQNYKKYVSKLKWI